MKRWNQVRTQDPVGIFTRTWVDINLAVIRTTSLPGSALTEGNNATAILHDMRKPPPVIVVVLVEQPLLHSCVQHRR